jgi:serine/threonine protein kinase
MSVSRRLGLNGTPDSASRSVPKSRITALSGKDAIYMDSSNGSPNSANSTNSPTASPKNNNSMLNSPKPSPCARVQIQSPAPQQGQQAPASYATLPALDRSHRYVITGTLQQSLFGVVKMAWDRKLRIQVAIKISRRERAAIQQTRSGVSVLENVRREASVMSYLGERSASGNSLSQTNSQITDNNAQWSNSAKKKSSRMIQYEKELAVKSSPTLSTASTDTTMTNSPSLEENNGFASDDSELDSEAAAMKTMTIDSVGHSSNSNLDILDLEGEKYICRFIEETEDEYFHYLINEFVPAGDLYSMLTSFPQHRLSEPQARGLFRQIVLGVKYLHRRNLAHLDMSLENICLDADENIRIIDFGVAAIHPHTSTTFQAATNYFQFPSSLQLGTPNTNQLKQLQADEFTNNFNSNDPKAPRRFFPCLPVLQLCNKPGKIRYMSPELFAGVSWDAFSNDIFSLGVILYSLLTGRPPFQQADNSDVWFNVIFSGQWLTQAIKKQPSAHVYTHLSNEVLDLINNIIKPEAQRLNIEAILSHPWMNVKDD